jgi:hypothetical protein
LNSFALRRTVGAFETRKTPEVRFTWVPSNSFLPFAAWSSLCETRALQAAPPARGHGRCVASHRYAAARRSSVRRDGGSFGSRRASSRAGADEDTPNGSAGERRGPPQIRRRTRIPFENEKESRGGGANPLRGLVCLRASPQGWFVCAGHCLLPRRCALILGEPFAIGPSAALLTEQAAGAPDSQRAPAAEARAA